MRSRLFFIVFSSWILCGSAFAQSVIEQMVCGDSANTTNCAMPSDLASLQTLLLQAVAESAYLPQNPPFTLEELRQMNVLSSVFIPEGRSLQRRHTSYQNPRVVMTPNSSLWVDRGETMGFFPNPVANQLFIGYSPASNALEIISWDESAGRYVFYTAENFPQRSGGPAPILRRVENQQTCIQCHQNGGPIFPRLPWTETSANDGVVRRLCQNFPNGEFQGIRFTEDCRRLRTQSQVGNVDLSVRQAASRLQARQACRLMCGTDQNCRKLLLESALRFPGSSAFIEELGRSSVEYMRESLGDRDHIDRNEFAQVSVALQSAIAPSWQNPPAPASQGFAHISSILPDRSPARRPQTYAVLSSSTSAPNPDLVFDESLTQFIPDSIRSIQIPIPRQRHRSDDPYTGMPADPLYARPQTSAIPVEIAGGYAADVAFECLGFNVSDQRAIDECKGRKPINEILSSSPVREAINQLAASWPLSGGSANDPTPPSDRIRTALMSAVRVACARTPIAAGASCPAPAAPSVLSGAQQADMRSLHSVLERVPEAGPRANAISSFMRYCSQCHQNGSSGGGALPLTDLVALKRFGNGSACRRLSLPESSPLRMPMRGAANPLSDADREEMLRLLGCPR